KKIGILSARERSVWLMDQRINQRGIKVDLELAAIARGVVEKTEHKLSAELLSLTGIDSHSKVKQLVEWLSRNGVTVPSVIRRGGKSTPTLDADTVEKLLETTEPNTTPHRVLKLRQELAKGSTKKLDAFIRATGSDGRVRYMFQYHGANTGRWAGRLINLTNLPRPPAHMEGYDPDTLAANIRTGDPDYLGFVYGDPLVAVSAGLRALLIADKGKKLVAGDYKSVESIGIAGLAGEKSKLEVFRQGKDPYCEFASFALGKLITKKDNPFERQTVGKPGELAFGFGGGYGAWLKFDDSGRFEKEEINGFKDAWRSQHPAIEALWAGLETAAITAMLDGRGEYRGIVYSRRGDFLVCTLPSGRNLSYFQPRLEERELPWSTPEKPAFGLQLTYMSWKGGQWVRVSTYGGKLAENCTQAACRDVLVHGMFNAEEAGLPIVLHVYDEIVVEVDEANVYAMGALQEAMEQKQPWYSDWPIMCDPWEGKRYRK
ncbi:MAG TPA: DNA polymerase, partial [Candidatus Paceibacterota bacterium]